MAGSATSGRALPLVGALAVAALSCRRDAAEPQRASDAARPPPATSAPAPLGAPVQAARAASPATAAVPAAIAGSGVESFAPLDAPGCRSASAEVAAYLKRGEIAAAAHGDAIAVAWLVEQPLRPKAQLAFAGYNLLAQQVARGRGLGEALEHAPRVFPSGDAWTVTWLGDGGLLHARARWEAAPPPEVHPLPAVHAEIAPETAIAASPGGDLVAVAPIGVGEAQLSMFRFAPLAADAPRVQALGVVRQARAPRRPAIAALPAGYLVAWFEQGGRIVAARFDERGSEGEAHEVMPAAEETRQSLTLVAAPGGAVAAWVDGDGVLARALDAVGRPAHAPQAIGRGRWPALAASEGGALLAWVGNDGQNDDQLLLARLGGNASPGASALRVSAPGASVRDPPGLAAAGPRAVLAWTEPVSARVSAKRALLRVVEPGCLPAPR